MSSHHYRTHILLILHEIVVKKSWIGQSIFFLLTFYETEPHYKLQMISEAYAQMIEDRLMPLAGCILKWSTDIPQGGKVGPL